MADVLELGDLRAGEREWLAKEAGPARSSAIIHLWKLYARQEQLPPPDEEEWTTWFLLGGRGSGKTRSGAEYVQEQAQTGAAKRIALVGPTVADVRDVMIEGDSGILAVARPDQRPRYEPSKRRLTWPNGTVGTTFSADKPDRMRGPQHDLAWCDEVGAWRYATDAWDNLMFGLRLGRARACVTTTPRPIKLIRDLRDDPLCRMVKMTTWENYRNLSPAYFDRVVAKYVGTRLGRQELLAEILDDVPGALWHRKMFDDRRQPQEIYNAEGESIGIDMQRIVVAIDPAATSSEDADETGIVVVGKGNDGFGYVLDDGSGRYTPDGWGRRAIGLFNRWDADRIIAEVNNGGEMVEHVLRTVDRTIPYKPVHASRGKQVRAEPVSALYEQERIFHVRPFDELEDQLCTWTPQHVGESPDRLDALVWGFTELFIDGGQGNLRFMPV